MEGMDPSLPKVKLFFLNKSLSKFLNSSEQGIKLIIFLINIFDFEWLDSIEVECFLFEL